MTFTFGSCGHPLKIDGDREGCRVCWLLGRAHLVDETYHEKPERWVDNGPLAKAQFDRGVAKSMWGGNREGANSYVMTWTVQEWTAMSAAMPRDWPSSLVFALEKWGIEYTANEAIYAADVVVEGDFVQTLAEHVRDYRRSRITEHVSPSVDPDPLVAGVGTLAARHLGAWPSNRLMMCEHADRACGHTALPILRPAYDAQGRPIAKAMRASRVTLSLNGTPLASLHAPFADETVRWRGVISTSAGSALEVPGVPPFEITRDGTYSVGLNVAGDHTTLMVHQLE